MIWVTNCMTIPFEFYKNFKKPNKNRAVSAVFKYQHATPLVLFSSLLFAAKSRYFESSVKVKLLRD